MVLTIAGRPPAHGEATPTWCVGYPLRQILIAAYAVCQSHVGCLHTSCRCKFITMGSFTIYIPWFEYVLEKYVVVFRGRVFLFFSFPESFFYIFYVSHVLIWT